MSVWSEIKKQTITHMDLIAPPEPKEDVVTRSNNELPPGTISFDIETGDSDLMWRAGPEFLRLSGYSVDDNEIINTSDHKAMTQLIENSDGWIVGHNILNYDLILLTKHCGLNLLKVAKDGRVVDTKLCAFLADPPLSRTDEGVIEKMFSLENTGQRYLGIGKLGNIKEIAKKYGGYDKIPLDDQEYNDYLRQDVVVTRDLVKVVPMNDYCFREHKINAVAATISIEGFRIDEDLLNERIRQGEEKRVRILTELHHYGLPGPEETKAPHRTNKGKLAIDQAFMDLGITLPRTPKSGSPAMGKDILQKVIDNTEDEEVEALAEAILSLNGIRTIYGNIHDNLIEGRVHPSINLRQSTGRWSIQNPGLTVVGKRDGKVIERAVFLPDADDHVLISCDLAQVDARAVAGLSQDLEYLKLFEEGRDLHSEMAVRLFGSKDFRERTKAASHGVNYGMRYRKLALTTGMSEEDADQFIQRWEETFPVLTAWQYRMREEGETTGVLYNGFGRILRIEPERAFTQAPALLGQSTARDILCEGVLRLWDIGGEDVIRMIRGVIHDELVMSVPIKDVDEIEKLVVDALSFEWCPVGGTYPVQILAGLNARGVNWADCYRKE